MPPLFYSYKAYPLYSIYSVRISRKFLEQKIGETKSNSWVDQMPTYPQKEDSTNKKQRSESKNVWYY